MNMEIKNLTILSDSLWTSGQPTREQFPEIASSGIQLVINLALSTSDNAIPDEQELVSSLGMEYVHIPVLWDAPSKADLQKFMAVMDAHPDQKILVHCALNYRASAFAALWRVLCQDWAVEDAFAAQKIIWALDDYPIWKTFVNDALAR